MIIIGITGTIGSGKGTVVEYLKNKYGFKHYSARAFIQEEVARRGMPDNRDSTHVVGNDLRDKYGAEYIAEQLFDRALKDGGNSVLESLRSPSEVKALRNKKQRFLMLATDADPKIRYERIGLRKSSHDNVTFEKFLSDEEREMRDTRPNGMNIVECIKMADAHVENNGDLEALHAQIDKIIAPLLN